MPLLRDYHIFISHSWDYSSQYEKICEWLDNTVYFSWTDYSVPITNPINSTGVRDLQEKIKNRISMCSCIIILSGMYVDYSDWIEYEIKVAKELNKPIIGVVPWGHERIPQIVQESASVMVGWNAKSIIDAIREYAL